MLIEWTVSVTRPAASSGGNCALICVGEVYSSGIVVALAVTQTPPITLESGRPLAESVSARFEPKMLMSDPGAMGLVKLAPFSTLAALKLGGRPSFRLSGTVV